MSALPPHHPSYAMATRRAPGLLYAVAFVVCMAVMILAFTYFVDHSYFLIHVPQFTLQLPDLHLTGSS